MPEAPPQVIVTTVGQKHDFADDTTSSVASRPDETALYPSGAELPTQIADGASDIDEPADDTPVPDVSDEHPRGARL